uniref:C-type lectin domain-containing protein n=1 Tax=Ascaris lumbricoides TaxID=6252 RepID=A0A9J2P793_ASCLU
MFAMPKWMELLFRHGPLLHPEMLVHEHVEKSRTWIGYHRSPTGKWSWLDGSLNNFSNWYIGRPKSDDPDNSCVQMFPMGTWFDVYCQNENSYGIFCKMPSYMTGDRFEA